MPTFCLPIGSMASGCPRSTAPRCASLRPHSTATRVPKHVSGIEFLADYRRGHAERQTIAHPRGRVAYEERGRFLPGWVYRYAYRALIPWTLAQYARAAQRRAEPASERP